jgi:hypothetical protein
MAITFAYASAAKGGKRFEKEVHAPRLAAAVTVLRQSPGRRLFQYRSDDGAFHEANARDVNRFLREIASAEISLKGLRTLLASVAVLNITIYSDRDRFRGVSRTRMVVFMNPSDIARVGLKDGEHIGLATAIEDGTHRHVDGFVGRPYNVPEGCLAGYYPECNPLVPLSHHAHGSFVPAVKGVPVRIVKVGRQP